MCYSTGLGILVDAYTIKHFCITKQIRVDELQYLISIFATYFFENVGYNFLKA